MNTASQIDATRQSPEEILLALQAANRSRLQRDAEAGRNRAALLLGGILFIAITATVALLYLQRLATEMGAQRRAAALESAEPATVFSQR